MEARTDTLAGATLVKPMCAGSVSKPAIATALGLDAGGPDSRIATTRVTDLTRIAAGA